MATKTEIDVREGDARERTQEPRERLGEGNGHGAATGRQIREDQDRFAELQARYQQQAEAQAEEVKRQLQQANEVARDALGQYVRAVARGYQAFVPQAVIDPRQAIDLVGDVVVQSFELQRSLLQELVSAGQVSSRAIGRTAEGLSENR